MKYIKEYKLKEQLKKKLDKIILEQKLSTQTVISMLEELIKLYK